MDWIEVENKNVRTNGPRPIKKWAVGVGRENIRGSGTGKRMAPPHLPEVGQRQKLLVHQRPQARQTVAVQVAGGNVADQTDAIWKADATRN